MKFYKAIEKTDTFSEYGDALIPEDIVAFYMRNTERKEIRDATVQEIAVNGIKIWFQLFVPLPIWMKSLKTQKI